eukprot:2968723-Prymnesium_polylepis.1
MQSLEERIGAIADEKSTSASQEMDGAIRELRAGLSDNRAQIEGEMKLIDQLRQDAAGIEQGAVSNGRLLALAVGALGVVAAGAYLVL